MIPKLTDKAVAELPLGAGRAELLEEIMSTEAPDRPAPAPAQTRSHRGFLVPLAAAAVVGAIAVSSLWWRGVGDEGIKSAAKTDVAAQEQKQAQDPTQPQAQPQAQPHQPGYRAVLDASGWTVSSTTDDGEGYGEVIYANGDASLQITWYPAKTYATYLEDRRYIVDPPADGAPIEVLGRSGQLWSYSTTDHAVMREVEEGHWMEFRGMGLDEATYRQLLGQLRMVGLEDYELALPDRYVTKAERREAAVEMLAGITEVSGAGLPGGQTPTLESAEQDPYHLGADVTAEYTCAWLGEFAAARAAGDDARATEAARVLGTAREWPVLQQMNPEGDWPEVLWDYADRVVAGRSVPEEEYAMGLGCP